MHFRPSSEPGKIECDHLARLRLDQGSISGRKLLINLDEATRQFRVGVSGLPGLRIEGGAEFAVEPGRVHTVTLTLSSPLEGMPSGVQPIAFETVALHHPSLAVREKSTFILPTH